MSSKSKYSFSSINPELLSYKTRKLEKEMKTAGVERDKCKVAAKKKFDAMKPLWKKSEDLVFLYLPSRCFLFFMQFSSKARATRSLMISPT